ncbi:uncharacterized protein MELLADRAFT_111491 [Melampsora larici-populina 98AG31]|uniref:DUF7872 domain-containing protein n=1 Tax=Melampsora larici-populina (strain 98AG31 / pathotype 3-4-7) TaxID=747676 RepID=F4S3C8_MELLP|nr:uncharacterized protein MELLADRAFT_111491 [Melampsora larici-populina 98AG31]EGG00791.1 hypothetical protein MELLADRAFT_111491 [Melampsora larici-populina 98AG31]
MITRTPIKQYNRVPRWSILVAYFWLWTSVHAQPPQPIGINLCDLPRKPDSQLWNQLKLDQYIQGYPNGQNLSVIEFARQNGAENFLCGIGEKCNIGELCHPVQGPAWHVLFAIQEWNMFMNSVYMAVATTMDLVRVTTASLLMDLTDPNEKDAGYVDPMFILSLLGAFFVSLSLGVFYSLATIAYSSSWFTISALSVFLGIGSTLSFSGLQISTMVEQEKAIEETAFNKWSRFGYYFSQWEDAMHQGITHSVNATLHTGISDLGPSGIVHFLGNGSFFQSHPRKTSAEIELGLKDVTQIRALVILLRSMNAFVTRGSGPCTGRGTNGAWDGDDHLSYCGPDKIMMNIVIADGKHAKNTFFNAKAIALKYSITTEYLTVNSWTCQQKYGIGADPYAGTAMPMDVSSECVANLPVCDCTDPEIRKAIKKHGTVRACRDVGKLPI